jgi:hypothetical protein
MILVLISRMKEKRVNIVNIEKTWKSVTVAFCKEWITLNWDEIVNILELHVFYDKY